MAIDSKLDVKSKSLSDRWAQKTSEKDEEGRGFLSSALTNSLQLMLGYHEWDHENQPGKKSWHPIIPAFATLAVTSPFVLAAGAISEYVVEPEVEYEYSQAVSEATPEHHVLSFQNPQNDNHYLLITDEGRTELYRYHQEKYGNPVDDLFADELLVLVPQQDAHDIINDMSAHFGLAAANEEQPQNYRIAYTLDDIRAPAISNDGEIFRHFDERYNYIAAIDAYTDYQRLADITAYAAEIADSAAYGFSIEEIRDIEEDYDMGKGMLDGFIYSYLALYILICGIDGTSAANRSIQRRKDKETPRP